MWIQRQRYEKDGGSIKKWPVKFLLISYKVKQNLVFLRELSMCGKCFILLLKLPTEFAASLDVMTQS